MIIIVNLLQLRYDHVGAELHIKRQYLVFLNLQIILNNVGLQCQQQNHFPHSSSLLQFSVCFTCPVLFIIYINDLLEICEQFVRVYLL